MNEKYNGWTNRETWLVNLYFGSDFEEIVKSEIEETGEKMSVDEIAEKYEEFVTSMFDDEIDSLSPFLQDLIDLGIINWYELAEAVLIDFS